VYRTIQIPATPEYCGETATAVVLKKSAGRVAETAEHALGEACVDLKNGV